jgi:adenylate cyclase associated (CAP) protein
MSELDDAIARLDAAVARLEAVSGAATRATDDSQAAEQGQVPAVAAAIVGRIDAALARLEQLLEAED